MEKSTKQIIIAATLVSVVAGGIILTVHLARKSKLKRDCKSAGGNWDKKQQRCLSESGTTVVLDDQTKEDIGRKVNTHPTLKYTNVRSSPKIEDPSVLGYLGAIFGSTPTSNIIGRVTQNPVGVIQQSQTSDDGYTWYLVKLNKNLEGKTTGYVREDAISFT